MLSRMSARVRNIRTPPYCVQASYYFFFQVFYLFLLKYLFLIFVILQTQKIFTFIREDYSTNITNYYILILKEI